MGTETTAATVGRTEARKRRFDPQRRDHIVQVAVRVVEERGVAGLTQRVVAAEADVPLGSITYHFPSRDDLVRAAFESFVAQQNKAFAGRFARVRTREELCEALIAVADVGPGRARAGVLGFELYLAALRDPGLRALTAGWTAASRAVLGRLMDAASAADVDAYLEGLILHGLVGVQTVPAEDLRASIDRLLAGVEVRVSDEGA